MNIPFNISTAIAVIGCILAIIAVMDGRRRLAIQEGKHLEKLKQLEDRVLAIEMDTKGLHDCYQTTEADIREIKTDLTWIKEALVEIKNRLPQ